MQNVIPKPEISPPEAPPGGSVAQRVVARGLEPRREAYAREVQALIEATFGLIQEKGDLEPRVSEIVRAAGLSNQAFYRHFRSKDELLVAVLDEGIRILAEYLTRRMGAVDDPAGRVRAWLEGMLEQALHPEGFSATRPFALARGRMIDDHPAEVAGSESQLRALVRDALRDAVASGALPGADPERDAETLYHLALGWMQARLVDGAPGSRADAERLVRFAMHGLGRPVAD